MQAIDLERFIRLIAAPPAESAAIFEPIGRHQSSAGYRTNFADC
jgi:hypothetical protein